MSLTSLSANTAIIQILIAQLRADRCAGIRTAGLVSGYPGSPLGRLDSSLLQHQSLLDKNNILFQPGINEELAATALMGGQIANLFPKPKYDGVLGIWFGKSPGVDRAGDIFRHANYAGVGKNGGVLAIAGDDAGSKSSSLPSCSIASLYDAQMPIVYPGSIEEIITLGRYGFELSRYSGLWVGFKISSEIGNLSETIDLDASTIKIRQPDFQFNHRPWQATQITKLLPPSTLQIEKEITNGRLEAAKKFAAVNKLNQVVVKGKDAWLGIIVAGDIYYSLMHAFQLLGLDKDGIHDYGIRLLKLAIIYPLNTDIFVEFSHNLEKIIVIEEKRSFIELFVKDILYSKVNKPLIVGKYDEQGRELFPAYGVLGSHRIAQVIRSYLGKKIPDFVVRNDWHLIDSKIIDSNKITLIPQRQPHFCSGCPHNRSTKIPDNALVGMGVGCHGLDLLKKDEVSSLTQMGGEGAQWVGMSSFTNVSHQFQNIGDGTFFHSGSLAVRQAIAANSHITFKILYNSAVGMTSSQIPTGAIPVIDLVKLLYAEGVKQVAVVTDNSRKYAAEHEWDNRATVKSRDQLNEIQDQLRRIRGVTVLIYDQECALEKRRKRRKLAQELQKKVFINQQVCEGCKDCGIKSNCLSLLPVESEFGQKVSIDQSSCNEDYSCLDGFCPALVTVSVGEPDADTITDQLLDLMNTDIAEPECTDEGNICLIGVGGSGVITVSKILVQAAAIAGKYATVLDQTGISQRAGSVISQVKISAASIETGAEIVAGEASGFVVLDTLSAMQPAVLELANVETVAVVSTSVYPTDKMVSTVGEEYPKISELVNKINTYTDRKSNVFYDAREIAKKAFGDGVFANIILLGSAYQKGIIPISRQAIEQVLLHPSNMLATKKQQAFTLGRHLIANSDIIEKFRTQDTVKLTTSDRISLYFNELHAYQNYRYAQDYIDLVNQVLTKEQAIGRDELSNAVMINLYKLMAYKDEYEIARLYTSTKFQQAVELEFGRDAQVYYHFYLPVLSRFRRNQKISLPPWTKNFLRLLALGRYLRGTPLDIFSYFSLMRKVEKGLIIYYKEMIQDELRNLNAENYEQLVNFAVLPDMIKGYGDIKLDSVRRFFQEARNMGFGKSNFLKNIIHK